VDISLFNRGLPSPEEELILEDAEGVLWSSKEEDLGLVPDKGFPTGEDVVESRVDSGRGFAFVSDDFEEDLPGTKQRVNMDLILPTMVLPF
jgi:hypothetical protein